MVAQSRGDPFIDAMADKLEEIFKMQETLNKRIGVETAGMTEEEKVKWTLNYLRAMQQEMAELTDSVPWKWWAKYQKLTSKTPVSRSSTSSTSSSRLPKSSVCPLKTSIRPT